MFVLTMSQTLDEENHLPTLLQAYLLLLLLLIIINI